jgi:hypothetical protein
MACVHTAEAVRIFLGIPDPVLWVTRAELRRVLEEALRPYSLCSRQDGTDSCSMDCGFGHLRGCAAVKEYLKDQLLELDAFLADMK